MRNADRPSTGGSGQTLSVIMPVFNTGFLLIESVESVLRQDLFQTMSPSDWELILVDDRSTDADTALALVKAESLSPHVKIVKNFRTKGAAGARNAGLLSSRATWIAFLDSDDIWYRDFLTRQGEQVAARPEVVWTAAHFLIGDESAKPNPLPLRDRSPCLHRIIEDDYRNGRSTLLRRPVEMLLRCGCIAILTVMATRSVLLAANGFDEALSRAEDYDLWMRLSIHHDLLFLPFDAGVYRTRTGSLTKSGEPMYQFEDRMLRGALKNFAFDPYRAALRHRLAFVYDAYCYHYRRQRMFGFALWFALHYLRLAPVRTSSWRQLAAAILRR